MLFKAFEVVALMAGLFVIMEAGHQLGFPATGLVVAGIIAAAWVYRGVTN